MLHCLLLWFGLKSRDVITSPQQTIIIKIFPPFQTTVFPATREASWLSSEFFLPLATLSIVAVQPPSTHHHSFCHYTNHNLPIAPPQPVHCTTTTTHCTTTTCSLHHHNHPLHHHNRGHFWQVCLLHGGLQAGGGGRGDAAMETGTLLLNIFYFSNSSLHFETLMFNNSYYYYLMIIIIFII